MMGPEVPPESTPAEDSFPWPPPPGRPALTSLVLTWQESVFRPTRFFQSLPVPGRVGPAVIYFLIIGIAAVGVTLFWQSIFTLLFGSGPQLGGWGSRPSSMGWGQVIDFLLSPLYLLIGLGLYFIITHAILAIFGGARRGPGTTIRVLAFSYGPALFAIIPFIGSMVGGIWTLVLAIIGLREAHQTDGWRAAVAIILPLGAAIILALIAALFFGALAAFLAL